MDGPPAQVGVVELLNSSLGDGWVGVTHEPARSVVRARGGGGKKRGRRDQQKTTVRLRRGGEAGAAW